MKKLSNTLLLRIFALLLLLGGTASAFSQVDSTGKADFPEGEFIVELNIGVGLALVGANSYVKELLYNGPALIAELEMPFTESHFFSAILSYHLFTAKKRIESHYGFHIIDDEYYQLSNDFYYQHGLSLLIKFYFTSKKTKLRPFIELGYMRGFISKTDYQGIDTGIGANYRLNGKTDIGLCYKGAFAIHTLSVGGGGSGVDVSPALFFLFGRFRIN